MLDEQRKTTPGIQLKNQTEKNKPQMKVNFMQNLSPRHVKTEESLRLGVVSGWYSTKVSGTFVSGPHETEAECIRKIAEIDPPAKGKKAR